MVCLLTFFSVLTDLSPLVPVLDKKKLLLKKLSDPSNNFIGSGFRVYSSETKLIPAGSYMPCEGIHCPVPGNMLCHLSSIIGLRVVFNLFEETNNMGQVKLVELLNKTTSPVTISH